MCKIIQSVSITITKHISYYTLKLKRNDLFMDRDYKIAIVGGDARQIFCGKKLSQNGYEVALYGFDEYKGDVGKCTKCTYMPDAVKGAGVVILPLPSTNDNENINMPLSKDTLKIKKLFESLDKNTLVLCAKCKGTISEISKQYGFDIVDYCEREEFQIANAIPTAESALAIAINEIPKTINSSTCLVMGYGRIGKVLCRHLSSLGAKVYASARKCTDFAKIESLGYEPIHTDEVESVLPKCDVIFNTIPKTVLTQNLLCKIDKGALIIDLASKPGGVDFESAKKANLNVIWALSLPGKTAPVTAGEILCKTALNIISEKAVTK